jgi:hypothetical protein
MPDIETQSLSQSGCGLKGWIAEAGSGCMDRMRVVEQEFLRCRKDQTGVTPAFAP